MPILVLWLACAPPSPVPGRLPGERVRVVLDAGEAEAVLAILQKRQIRAPIVASDWEKLFRTSGYRRLEAREAAMKRAFTRDEFEAFVESPELAARTQSLAATLASWRKVDATSSARRALAYLPPGAEIHATIFPLIKPKPNSFVFDEPDPAIFLALDPAVTADQLANTLAHELHHIGFGTACPPKEARAETERLPRQPQDALKWLSAFGEGFAMLAAAGGPDVHPHAVSGPEDRARWDRDMRRADEDLRDLDVFFRDVLEGRLRGEKADERGFSFFGIQGPWYTVGYRMAVAIEKAFGRETLIRSFCDPSGLPAAYNRAADELHDGGARWSRELLAALSRPDRFR